MKDKVDAINDIGHMIRMISQAEGSCEILDADWYKIGQIAEAWRNPYDV